MSTKVLIFVFFAITLTIHRTNAEFYNNPTAIPIPADINGAWDGFHSFSGSHVGQRVEGLSKLKSYFNDFGYIPSPPDGDFSDDYDESLVSAIKLYHQKFGLGITGELDDATISYIVKPRCGVADIINGTNTMAIKKTPVAHYTYMHGKVRRWPVNKKTLTYAFLPQNQLTDPIKSVFARAFSHWPAVIPLNFTETDAYNSADIKIGFYTGAHGDDKPFDGVLGKLAHAFAPTDGRFHVDNAETWVYDGDVTKSSVDTTVDLESVSTHEIGHLLGLDHTPDKSAVMYAYIEPKMRKVDLAADDLEGIQSLYGKNPSYNPSFSEAGDGGVRLLLRWRGSLWGLAVMLWCLVFFIRSLLLARVYIIS